MPLRQSIENNLHEALRANNEEVKNTLRLLLASVKYADKEKGQLLDDDAIMVIIQKEIKMRKETIEGAKAGARDDLISKANKEVLILTAYLPKQLDEAEMRVLIQSAINDTGALSAADTGKVMKAVMPKVRGQATGDVVSRIVKELLSN